MRIYGSHVQGVAEDSQATTDASAAEACLRNRRVTVDPKQASGRGIESDDVVSLHCVEHTIYHQRSRFVGIEPTRLKHPLQFKVTRIGRRDLVEETVMLAAISTCEGEPVLRLGIWMQEPLRRDAVVCIRPRIKDCRRPCMSCAGGTL